MRASRLALAAALGLVAGLALILDRLFPPSLDRAAHTSTLVLDDGGSILRAFATTDDKWRLPADPARIDPHFVDMLLAYEDRRFRAHPGVDPLAVARAAGQLAASGRVVSGASTITMQTARLLEPRPRGLPAKLVEMARAVQLETRLSKDEILALYLTLAPYGGNLEGVRAAALAYFGEEPAHLTIAEAALLVALPQSPERRRPDRHPDEARRARDAVLDRLAEAGVLAADEAAQAKAEPLPPGRRAMPLLAPHLAQRLKDERPGAAVIATSLDGRLQAAAEELARREVGRVEDGGSLALVVVENRTRRVRAYVGGPDYFGRAGQIDLARALRSPGSALKPFIYGLAFDDLLVHPETLIDDLPMTFGDYSPRNFDRDYQGTVSIRAALQHSLNVPAIALLDRIGPTRLAAVLRQSGARLAYGGKGADASLPIGLGGVGISLLDLTMLYAGLADGGRVLPLAIAGPPATAQPARLFGEVAAWYVADILAGSPLPDGLAQGQGVVKARRVSFKTGTSYGFRDAWALGFSDQWTVGVWVGRPDGSSRPGRFGRNTAAPILVKAFDLLPPEPAAPRPPPADAVLVAGAEWLPPALRHFGRAPVAGRTRIARAEPPRCVGSSTARRCRRPSRSSRVSGGPTAPVSSAWWWSTPRAAAPPCVSGWTAGVRASRRPSG